MVFNSSSGSKDVEYVTRDVAEKEKIIFLWIMVET